MNPEDTSTNVTGTSTHAPAAAPAGSADWYTSNPFLVSLKGLVLLFQHNPISILLALLLLILVFVVFGIVSGLVSSGAEVVGNVIMFVGFLLLVPVFSGVYYAIAAASLDKETITTRQSLGRAMAKVLPLLGLTILLVLLLGVGFLLLIIPGIILMGRTSLAGIVMFKENLGPLAAIKRSMELTKGHTIEMIGAIFAGSLLSGNGLLAPATTIAPLVGRYEEIKKLKESGAAKPPMHWLNWFMPLLLVILLVGYGVLMVNAFKSGPKPNPYGRGYQIEDSNSQFKFDESELDNYDFNGQDFDSQSDEFNFE